MSGVLLLSHLVFRNDGLFKLWKGVIILICLKTDRFSLFRTTIEADSSKITVSVRSRTDLLKEATRAIKLVKEEFKGLTLATSSLLLISLLPVYHCTFYGRGC